MRLGYLLRYAGLAGGPPMEHVLEAEKLGYHSVWCGEAYGNDAVSPIAWVLARRGVTSVIIGPRTFEQYEQNMEGFDLQLDPATVKQLSDLTRWAR